VSQTNQTSYAPQYPKQVTLDANGVPVTDKAVAASQFGAPVSIPTTQYVVPIILGIKDVGADATPIVLTPSFDKLRGIKIGNLGPLTVYLGNSPTMTAPNGFKLGPGDTFSLQTMNSIYVCVWGRQSASGLQGGGTSRGRVSVVIE
jgi:hypothetical protein